MLALKMLPEFEEQAKERESTNIGNGKRIRSTVASIDATVKNRKATDKAGEQFGI